MITIVVVAIIIPWIMPRIKQAEEAITVLETDMEAVKKRQEEESETAFSEEEFLQKLVGSNKNKHSWLIFHAKHGILKIRTINLLAKSPVTGSMIWMYLKQYLAGLQYI